MTQGLYCVALLCAFFVKCCCSVLTALEGRCWDWPQLKRLLSSVVLEGEAPLVAASQRRGEAAALGRMGKDLARGLLGSSEGSAQRGQSPSAAPL